MKPKAGLKWFFALSSLLCWVYILLVAVLVLNVAQIKRPQQDMYVNKPMAPTEVAAMLPAGIDLNAATLQDLQALPGVGEKTAQAIISFREEHGSIHYAEDLLSVPGIGQARFEAIKAFIYVGLN